MSKNVSVKWVHVCVHKKCPQKMSSKCFHRRVLITGHVISGIMRGLKKNMHQMAQTTTHRQLLWLSDWIGLMGQFSEHLMSQHFWGHQVCPGYPNFSHWNWKSSSAKISHQVVSIFAQVRNESVGWLEGPIDRFHAWDQSWRLELYHQAWPLKDTEAVLGASRCRVCVWRCLL